jgi:hypothetical protein
MRTQNPNRTRRPQSICQVVIKKTTLEKTAYKAKYWKSSKKIQMDLFDIINDLSLDYFNLTVIHEESKLISLVLEDEKNVYRVRFPSVYPNCPQSIFASNYEGVCCPVEAILEWEKDEPLATITTEYINNTIKILNEQMIA